MAEQSRRPAFQFYPGDEERETSLRLVSLAAYGLWKRMLNLMHDGLPYGHLTTAAGAEITPAQLARLVGETAIITKRLLAELEEAGVFSRDGNGIIHSRRMVRDEHIRSVRAAAGATGGARSVASRVASGLLKQNAKQAVEQKGTPSSSSSSSDLPSGDGPAQAQAPTRTREAKRRAGPLPADWAPNDTHRRIAADERRDLNREVQNFRDHAAANGRLQVDWNAAFCTWLRSPYGRDGGPGGTALAVQPSLIPSVDRTAALIDASRAEKDAQAAWMNRISTAFAALEEDERAAIEQAAAARPKVAATAGTLAYRTVLRIAMLRIYGEKVGDPRPEVVDG
jgi:hypothetical protein